LWGNEEDKSNFLESWLMKESRDYTERRLHERSRLHNIVIGILNSDEPGAIGSIIDISLGGVRCTYDELTMAPNDRPCHSIDLIADDQYLGDIPCECAWNVNVETESFSKLTNLRQCGIQFGKLTPSQIFLLRSFINHCGGNGTNNINSNVHMSAMKLD
jgi:hypothetical protein